MAAGIKSSVYTIYVCTECGSRHNGTRPKREQKCAFCKAPLKVEDEWGAEGYYDCSNKDTWKISKKYLVSKVLKGVAEKKPKKAA